MLKRRACNNTEQTRTKKKEHEEPWPRSQRIIHGRDFCMTGQYEAWDWQLELVDKSENGYAGAKDHGAIITTLAIDSLSATYSTVDLSSLSHGKLLDW